MWIINFVYIIMMLSFIILSTEIISGATTNFRLWGKVSVSFSS